MPLLWVVVSTRGDQAKLLEQLKRLRFQACLLPKRSVETVILDLGREPATRIATDHEVRHVHHTAHGSPSLAHHAAVALSPNNAAVLELDEGDWIEPRSLRLVERAFRSGAELVLGDRILVREPVDATEPDRILSEGPYQPYGMRRDDTFHWGLCAYTRQLYDRVGGYCADNSDIDTRDLLIRLGDALRGEKIVSIPRPLCRIVLGETADPMGHKSSFVEMVDGKALRPRVAGMVGPEVQEGTRRIVLTEVLLSRIPYGRLGLDGDLGYQGKSIALQGKAVRTVVSAHGPSELVIAVAAGEELLLAGALNDDAREYKVAARFTVEDRSGRMLADLGVAIPAKRTETTRVRVPDNGRLVLRCTATTQNWCHALWLFENADVRRANPEHIRQNLTERALELARRMGPGEEGNHGLYVQSYGDRIEMAIRCIASHMVAACERPKRVLFVSFDRLDESKLRFPSWWEVWSGEQKILSELRAAGLSEKALTRLTQQNVHAKYAIPRLLMGDRVVVCDDDVMWAGHCERMLHSEADYVFLEDPPGYYGAASVSLFRTQGLVGPDADTSPFLCSGVYVMNRKAVRDAELVSQVIENACCPFDEQSAVAMETRMEGVQYEVLGRPRYAHGGHGRRPVPRQAELVHMQGFLEHLRRDADTQAWLLDKAVASCSSRDRQEKETAPQETTFAVCMPVAPSQSALLDMHLRRAADVGALQKAEMVFIVEGEPDERKRTTCIRDICNRYGVCHTYADATIGYATPRRAREAIRRLSHAARSAPEAQWIVRTEAAVLLVGDMWSYLAARGVAEKADICANVRPDDRLGPEGLLVFPGVAFTSATCLQFEEIAKSPVWGHIEPMLVGRDDVDMTLVARLLGKEIAYADGKQGLTSLRDMRSPYDEDFWACDNFRGTVAIYVAGRDARLERMKAALARIQAMGAVNVEDFA